jgi:hypothetical protein
VPEAIIMPATPSSPGYSPAPIYETILTGLIPLFLIAAGNNQAAARHAAAHMLSAYRPETNDELRLAANIVAFSFQALEALGQAAAPDLPVTRVLRLRSSAVALSRESAKAERRLALLQKARQQPQPEPQPEAVEPAAKPQPIAARPAAPPQAHAEQDRRIAASIQRAEDRISAMAQSAIARTPSDLAQAAIACAQTAQTAIARAL